jgi:hypothetical protein
MAQSMRIFKKEIGTDGKPKVAEAKPEAEVAPEGEQKQG